MNKCVVCFIVLCFDLTACSKMPNPATDVDGISISYLPYDSSVMNVGASNICGNIESLGKTRYSCSNLFEVADSMNGGERCEFKKWHATYLVSNSKDVICVDAGMCSDAGKKIKREYIEALFHGGRQEKCIQPGF